jgi:AraC-like DNA-binding protein
MVEIGISPRGFTHAFQRWSGIAPSEWRTN